MWWVLAVFAVALIATVVMMPSMTQTQRHAAGIDEIKVPTNGGGREIPVLFGTTDIYSLQVGWYGDLSTGAIKKG